VFPRKYRVHIFLTVIALGIIFFSWRSHQPGQQRIDASEVVISSFLELVDAGQYEQSWESCAAYLKNETPQQEWVKYFSAVRSVAGKLLVRKQFKISYTKSNDEGIPNGEYMVYHYESNFQNKDHLIETVTVMLEPDNLWRIASYSIK